MSRFPGLLGTPQTSLVRPMFRSLAIAASGLSAQRQRMEVAAHNIANAETTATPEGGPYRRRVVTMAENTPAVPPFQRLLADMGTVTTPPALPLATPDPVARATGVTVTGVVEDLTEGALVYQPGHPSADAQGYVRMPNVRVTDEIVDMMDAKRIYEANASVFQSVKAMLRAAINL